MYGPRNVAETSMTYGKCTSTCRMGPHWGLTVVRESTWPRVQPHGLPESRRRPPQFDSCTSTHGFELSWCATSPDDGRRSF